MLGRTNFIKSPNSGVDARFSPSPDFKLTNDCFSKILYVDKSRYDSWVTRTKWGLKRSTAVKLFGYLFRRQSAIVAKDLMDSANLATRSPSSSLSSNTSTELIIELRAKRRRD